MQVTYSAGKVDHGIVEGGCVNKEGQMQATTVVIEGLAVYGKEHGAAVIYAHRMHVGDMAEAWPDGAKDRLRVQMQRRVINGNQIGVAVFPTLAPGNWNFHWGWRNAKLTVFPAEVTEIDWQ
jgi:hypothetical protein